MWRMTRLTNAFSKKLENLQAVYSLWFAFYYFCWVQKTESDHAIESGVTDHVFELGELLI
jgi:hypothetical protein